MTPRQHDPDSAEGAGGVRAAMSTGPIGAGVLPASSEPSTASLALRDFLTDGSFVRLLEELERLTSVGVRLRDASGQWIVLDPARANEPSTPIEPGQRSTVGPWRFVDPEPGWESAEHFPLTVDDREIGAVVLAPGEPTLSSDAAARYRAAVKLLTNTASELCRDVVELRHRMREIEVLYHLSSMLVAGRDADDIVSASLSAALGVLGLDAGSVVLLPRDQDGLPSGNLEEELTLLASHGLSETWLNNPLPLSRGRAFDRAALSGELVAIPDLLEDPRVNEPQRCIDENVRGFVSTGLTFGRRSIGLIRLYSRTPRAFTAGELRLLKSIGQHAAAAVEQARLIEAETRERAVAEQLRLAGEVQSRMLPRTLPVREGVTIAARSVPSYDLGGDFYDVFDRADGTLGLCVGDVVGKGVVAGVMMAAVRAALRAHTDAGGDPAEILARVNNDLCRDTLPNEFATLWFGVLDTDTRTLRWASAGHERPILLRRQETDDAQGFALQRLAVGGLVAGVVPNETYTLYTTVLEPGDAIIIYSDGVTDATDFHGERYGRVRFEESLAALMHAEAGRPRTPGQRTGEHADAQRLLDHALWDIRRFVGLSRQADDETLLVLRRD